jgi:hypothetical protein
MRRNAGAAAVPAPVARSLANAAPRVYWLDQPDAPEPLPALAGNVTADLAIVGGGFTGLWTALLATERDTGLGVGATRFAAQVMLDMLEQSDTERRRLTLVRSKAGPVPAGTVAFGGRQLTRSSVPQLDLTGLCGAPSVLLAPGGGTPEGGTGPGEPPGSRCPELRACRATPGTLVSWRYGKSQVPAKFFGTELTPGRTRSKLGKLPRRRLVWVVVVCAGFLRTQQRVKSQCIDVCTTPVMAGSSLRGWACWRL